MGRQNSGQSSSMTCREADMTQRASCRPLQKNANRKIITQNGGMYAWSPTKLVQKSLVSDQAEIGV